MKILLHCLDVVGASMAGPAIRYWEFAKSLSKRHDVTLSTPNDPDISAEGFTIQRRQKGYVRQIGKFDVLITQLLSHQMALSAKQQGVRIILDAYDPMPLENLEQFKNFPLSTRSHKQKQVVDRFSFAFKMSDAILCANQRQRSLWMGMLMGLHRITPSIYDEDNKLKQLIGIVPFGLSSTPPEYCGEGLRKKFNLKPTDNVILWGGGIWNWFDPLTLIKAIAKLIQEGHPVYLVFMGVKHPNPHIPAMKMAADAADLAKELGLIDKYVFFNYSWTPYQERQGFLLDANIGISTHSDHLETQFAFRTRILDYLWAGLPIIATEGDYFAELIEREKLGIVVPYDKVDALAQAIQTLTSDSQTYQQMKRNIESIRPLFFWDNVVEPIHAMINAFEQMPRRKALWSDYATIAKSFYSQRSPTSIYQELRYRFQRRSIA